MKDGREGENKSWVFEGLLYIVLSIPHFEYHSLCHLARHGAYSFLPIFPGYPIIASSPFPPTLRRKPNHLATRKTEELKNRGEAPERYLRTEHFENSAVFQPSNPVSFSLKGTGREELL